MGVNLMESYSNSYKDAGVDVTAGYRAVELIKEHAKRTSIPGVVSGLGGFGGLFAPDLSGISEPVLVSGTDGVGTKLKIAFLMDKHDTVGIDCVAMCVNDVACSGAKPLFFLDYLAVGKNVPERVAQIVSGVADGCVQAGCALIGGETAEMPGFYPSDEYDLAGFSVGMADKSKLIDSSDLAVGDVLVGHDGGGVGVDQHHLDALFLQGAAGLGAGVVELGGLADDNGAGADDQDFLDGSIEGHYRSPPFISSTKRSNRKDVSFGPVQASGWNCTVKAFRPG